MTTIYWAGDSTVQYNDITTYPQTGLGQVLGLYLKPEIEIKNYAKNGASSKSFYNGPRLPLIQEEIKEGDFFFIEFGHNDEKSRPERHTEPFTEFGQVLERYVNIALDKSAHPVLITPLERRCFGEDGKLGPGGHADWVAGMKATGERLDVPVVDLYTRSREAMEKAGAGACESWYMNLPPDTYERYPEGHQDNSHLHYSGAVFYAGLIARGLGELGGIYADLLLDSVREEE